jgi:hypothetical protein
MEGKRKKKNRSSTELDKEKEDDVLTRVEEIKKHKKRKSKKNKEDNIVEDQDIENKKEKKKRKRDAVVTEITVENTKSKKRKTSKSKPANSDTFLFSDHKTTVNMETKEGWKDLIRNENVESDDDDDKTEMEKVKVSSSEKQRKKKDLKSCDGEENEVLSLSQNNQTVMNEDLSKTKMKEKRKKEAVKNPESIELQTTTDSDKTSSAEQALLYLRMWKKNRSKWTFKKVRQVWLLKHMFDTSKVSQQCCYCSSFICNTIFEQSI